MRKLALTFAALSAMLVGFAIEGCNEACTIGSESCDCTDGGACDPGLTCLSGLCVNAGPGSTTNASGETGTTNSTNTTDASTTNSTNTTDPSTGDGDGDPSTTGPKLDMGEATDTDIPCAETGCKKIDMLVAMDGSASMLQEIQALYLGGAFLDIVTTLENINCGDIDYRIGVTGDNDNGWVTPGNWADPNPWFDSETYTGAEISVHFQAAATAVANSGGASVGCEHVLSTAVNLLGGDQTGFLRDDALLVLVLMSDVDDYGWYDQLGGAPEPACAGFGCNVAGQDVSIIQDTLIALKDGDPAGVATIVIAGDPMANGGINFCGQPQSCGGGNSAFHAERLYEFAGLQEGMNGFTADICGGPSAVPDAVEAALTDNIDLACQEFEPIG